VASAHLGQADQFPTRADNDLVGRQRAETCREENARDQVIASSQSSDFDACLVDLD
jgi:hypothetical protein